MSSADGRPRRRGPIILTLAWLAVLAGTAALAAYAVVTGPRTSPVDDRPRLSMPLPDPPARQRSAAPSGGTGATDPDAGAPDSARNPDGDGEGDGTGDAPAAAEKPPSDGPAAAGSTRSADEAVGGAAATGDRQAEADGNADSGDGRTGAPATGATGTGDAETADGVGETIPQPPTDLLGSDDSRRPNGDGQRTASRSGTPGAGGATAPSSAGLPQLPVGDPDAPAWKRYAQRLNPPQGVPKIAVIVRGLGLSSAAAATAVNDLPAGVSLAFTPYARDRAGAWAAEARRTGHEVLVDLPMEPANYPATDPGPQALMTGISPRENRRRLDWLLAQVDREVGVVAPMSSAVLTSAKVAEPVLRDLHDRGLMVVDNDGNADGTGRRIARRVGLPFAVNDRTLDGGQVSRRAIEARLVEAERIAREQGLAVVMAHPYPVSLDLLVDWTGELEARGFVLVPATYAAIERAGRNAAQLR